MRRQDRERMRGQRPEGGDRPHDQPMPERKERERVRGGETEERKQPQQDREPGRMPLPD